MRGVVTELLAIEQAAQTYLTQDDEEQANMRSRVQADIAQRIAAMEKEAQALRHAAQQTMQENIQQEIAAIRQEYQARMDDLSAQFARQGPRWQAQLVHTVLHGSPV